MRAAARRLMSIVSIGVLAVPIILYLLFIHHFALDVLWGDSWHDIRVITQVRAGVSPLSTLWSQYFENRIFFPNLIVLALASTTHFNVVVEEYISALFLLTATVALIVSDRRRAVSTPWLVYLPVVVLMFTLVGGNPYYAGGETLFGFDMGWYLVVACLGVTLALLDGIHVTRWTIVVAAVLAVIGTYSSAQGLLIWPAGLALLYFRRRSGRQLLVWVAVAVPTVILYCWNYSWSYTVSQPGFTVRHPLAALQYFLYLIGNVVLGQQPQAGHHAVDLIVGVSILAISTWIVIATSVRRDGPGGSPLAAAIVIGGVLICAVTTAGRASGGYAAIDRYAMFGVLVWVGCYLGLLDFVRAESRRRSVDTGGRQLPFLRHGTCRTLALAGIAALIVVQVVLGTPSGLSDAAAWHRREVVIANVTVNSEHVPNDVLVGYLGLIPAYGPLVRELIVKAHAQRLSLFDSPLAAAQLRSGLLPYVNLVVLAPEDEAVVTGKVPVDTRFLEGTSGSTVQFRITGGRLDDALIGIGQQTIYGRAFRWNSETVPNGVYELQSVATTPHGEIRSAPITVVVRNGADGVASG